MGNQTRAVNHLTAEEVKEQIKASKDAIQRTRWQIVYTALINPRKAEEIATSLGVSKSLVQKIISSYNREGIQAIEIKPCGGRYHEYMTEEEEKDFLAPFWKNAARGELTSVRSIHQEYEKLVRHKVHVTTIYRMLERHKWRKIMPRPIYPKAEKEAQEDFKKTSLY